MLIEVPILIRPQTDARGRTTLHAVRPLFFSDPERSDRTLSKAVSELADDLRKHLESLARTGRHAALAAYTFSPDVRLERFELVLELHGDMFRGWFPLAVFHHAGRTLAVSPYLLELWFDIPRGESIAARATDVFTRHFRNLEKQQEGWQLKQCLAPFSSKTKPSLSLLRLEVNTRASLPAKDVLPFALLGGDEVMDGATELSRVGRCLQERYPDQLERALEHESLVRELADLLAMPDNRLVMLVGPPAVGKTALIHEVVYRDAEQRQKEATEREDRHPNHWLLTPQRLVTGMSFVGQWEERLLAILRHVRKRRHVLVFDDLLGLYQAGISAQSNLSAADVMKPYVERHEVRLLAEMTPEQLRCFRERDRVFADLFHLVRVEEPGEEVTLRILLGVIRSLESRHGTRFALPVLPTVLDLARRYEREAAFPGKAVRWLGQLAMKCPGRDVGRRDVLDEFRAKSGLELAFLDDEQQLPRDDVLAALRRRIIGQAAAVEAIADVVGMAKARLNDPQRPLGSLLLLGPTGVGKTECAKALAGYLFGDESRLLRFDMNEFISPHAAARLAGTFDQPEGLLTSAVRRQPFCVLLFDEIEKAHPDVFDLLLQVLGEARLTDALGRTTDFGNAVVILTSNLGTREATEEVGFVPGRQASGDVYMKAVESFFRPEFFNRLDRILPFQRLSRDELGQIARTIIAGILTRAGLAQRKCAVDVTGDAIEWMVDRGYHPALGARAMRRAVESELVRPVARRLAAILPETPTVVRVSRRREQLVAEVTPLAEAEPLPESQRPEQLHDPQEILALCRLACNRIAAACKAWRPAGEISAVNPSPLSSWHLGLMTDLAEVRESLRTIGNELRGTHGRGIEPMLQPRRARGRRSLESEEAGRRILKELYAAQDVIEYIQELSTEFNPPAARTGAPGPAERLVALLDRLALWDAVRPGEQGWQWERVLVLVRSLGNDEELRKLLGHVILCEVTFRGGSTEWSTGLDFGLAATRWTPLETADPDNGSSRSTSLRPGWLEWVADPELRAAYQGRHHLDAILFEGHRAERLLRLQEGTHLFVCDDGRLWPLQAIVLPLGRDEPPEQRLLDCLAAHDGFQDATTRDEPTLPPDPFAWQPVVVLHPSGWKAPVGFRSSSRSASPGAMFPLPPELRGQEAAGPPPSGSPPP